MKRTKDFDIKELGFIPPKYGGVSVSISRLINELSKEGFVVGGFYSHENRDSIFLGSNLFELELNLSTKRLLIELPRSLNILRNYRILHSHYSLEHMVYIWCFLLFLHKKIVITVHNSMVHSFYKQCDSINRYFLKKVANNPNVTWIAVSEQGKSQMLELPFTFKNPIRVIPAYIPDISSNTSSLPDSLIDYLNNHNKVITFYGHSFMMEYGRDVYGFMEALELFATIRGINASDIGLVLCLSDTEDVKKINSLHEKAKSLKIDELVYWQIGAISNMNALWDRTDVYIRPTCTDGDSVAVREALDKGVQVVASNVCPRPERCYTYVYGDKNDLLEKVNVALEIGHVEATPDYSNYFKIRDLYKELLLQT